MFLCRAKDRQRAWLEHKRIITRVGVLLGVLLTVLLLWFVTRELGASHRSRAAAAAARAAAEAEGAVLLKQEVIERVAGSAAAYSAIGAVSLDADQSAAESARQRRQQREEAGKLARFYNRDGAEAEEEEEAEEGGNGRKKKKDKSEPSPVEPEPEPPTPAAEPAAAAAPAPAAAEPPAPTLAPPAPALTKEQQSLLEDAADKGGVPVPAPPAAPAAAEPAAPAQPVATSAEDLARMDRTAFLAYAGVELISSTARENPFSSAARARLQRIIPESDLPEARARLKSKKEGAAGAEGQGEKAGGKHSFRYRTPYPTGKIGEVSGHDHDADSRAAGAASAKPTPKPGTSATFFSKEELMRQAALKRGEKPKDAPRPNYNVASGTPATQGKELRTRRDVVTEADALPGAATAAAADASEESREAADFAHELDLFEQRAQDAWLQTNYTRREAKGKRTGWVDQEGRYHAPLTDSADAAQSVLPISLVYDFGACGCSGWSVEAMNIVLGLVSRVQKLAIVAGKQCFCAGTSKDKIEKLEALRTAAFSINEWPGGVDVWLSHKPPQRYPHFPYNGVAKVKEEPLVVVGRSMAEVHRVPHHWATQIATLVDEVWIPSSHGLTAFTSAGVPASVLKVVPEPVDADLYNPLSTDPLPYDGLLKFNFLSIFKMEPRKGWKTLVRAFVEEFDSADSVTLFVHTYLFNEPLPYNKAEIERRIFDYIKTLDFGRRDLQKRPLPLGQIHVLTGLTPMDLMPPLYKSFQAFVLPSHGEGWGLPLQEAMAMGLPCVTTNWGGQLDFMHNGNSYLLPVERFEQAEGNDFEQGAKWAVPSLRALRQVMRHMVEHPSHTVPIAARGRAEVVDSYNVAAVTERVVERLEELLPLVNERREVRKAGGKIVRGRDKGLSVHSAVLDAGMAARRGGVASEVEAMKAQAAVEERELAKVVADSRKSGWQGPHDADHAEAVRAAESKPPPAPTTTPADAAAAPDAQRATHKEKVDAFLSSVGSGDEDDEAAGSGDFPAAVARVGAPNRRREQPAMRGADWGREKNIHKLDPAESEIRPARIKPAAAGASFGAEAGLDSFHPARPLTGGAISPSLAQAAAAVGVADLVQHSKDDPHAGWEAETVQQESDGKPRAGFAAVGVASSVAGVRVDGAAADDGTTAKPKKLKAARIRPTGSRHDLPSKLPDKERKHKRKEQADAAAAAAPAASRPVLSEELKAAITADLSTKSVQEHVAEATAPANASPAAAPAPTIEAIIPPPSPVAEPEAAVHAPAPEAAPPSAPAAITPSGEPEQFFAAAPGAATLEMEQQQQSLEARHAQEQQRQQQQQEDASAATRAVEWETAQLAQLQARQARAQHEQLREQRAQQQSKRQQQLERRAEKQQRDIEREQERLQSLRQRYASINTGARQNQKQQQRFDATEDGEAEVIVNRPAGLPERTSSQVVIDGASDGAQQQQQRARSRARAQPQPQPDEDSAESAQRWQALADSRLADASRVRQQKWQEQLPQQQRRQAQLAQQKQQQRQKEQQLEAERERRRARAKKEEAAQQQQQEQQQQADEFDAETAAAVRRWQKKAAQKKAHTRAQPQQTQRRAERESSYGRDRRRSASSSRDRDRGERERQHRYGRRSRDRGDYDV